LPARKKQNFTIADGTHEMNMAKTNWAKRKIMYQAAFDFNLLSTEIRETESFLLFKKKLERMP